MKLVLICAALSLGLSACSSAETSKNTLNANSNRTAAVGETAGNSVPDVNGPAIAANAPVTAKQEKMEALRQAGVSAPEAVPGEIPAGKLNSRPAPDNSEFVSTLTDVGRELRTFKDHPQLLKVEKIIDGKNENVKVYLRSGKVVNLAGSKIPNLATISAYDILNVAGLVVPPPPAQPNSDSKKPAG